MSRLNLHEELCEILGNRNVYFQPPASVRLNCPCIKYSQSTPDVKRADDKVYNSTERYELIYIDSDPDSKVPNEILNRFQMCRFDRRYVADNLNHSVLTIYY